MRFREAGLKICTGQQHIADHQNAGAPKPLPDQISGKMLQIGEACELPGQCCVLNGTGRRCGGQATCDELLADMSRADGAHVDHQGQATGCE